MKHVHWEETLVHTDWRKQFLTDVTIPRRGNRWKSVETAASKTMAETAVEWPLKKKRSTRTMGDNQSNCSPSENWHGSSSRSCMCMYSRESLLWSSAKIVPRESTNASTESSTNWARHGVESVRNAGKSVLWLKVAENFQETSGQLPACASCGRRGRYAPCVRSSIAALGLRNTTTCFA